MRPFTGSFNWSTRIASFKFPSCATAAQVLTTITVTPPTASVPTGGTQQYSATGRDQFGQLTSPQPTFSWSVTGGGTIDPTGLFTAATAGGPFTVNSSSGSVSGTATVNVTSAPTGDFTLSVSPPSATIQRGGTAAYTVTITPSNGFNGAVTFSLAGQPSGSTFVFTPNPAASTSTLTVATSSNTTKKTYALTITGASGPLSHTATANLKVNR